MNLSRNIPVCKERLNMCNRGLRKTPKHSFTTLKLMSTQPALLFTFNEKNACWNSFKGITFSDWVLTSFLMYSSKLLVHVPISLAKLGTIWVKNLLKFSDKEFVSVQNVSYSQKFCGKHGFPIWSITEFFNLFRKYWIENQNVKILKSKCEKN